MPNLPPPEQARLGILLPLLWPRQYEARYWQSAVYRRWANDTDAANIALRLSEIFLTVYLHRNSHNEWAGDMSLVKRASLNVTLLAALHLVLRLLFHDVYRQVRDVLLVHMRLYNVLVIVVLTRELLGQVMLPGHFAKWVAAARNELEVNNPIVGPRLIIMGTMAARTCLHSLPPTLSFTTALPIQAICLASIFRLMAGPAAEMSGVHPFLPLAWRACHAISRNLGPPAALPLALSLHQGVCASLHASWVVLVFTQAFVGFVLPLFVIYSWERRLKLRFLRQLQQEAQEATTGPPQQQHAGHPLGNAAATAPPTNGLFVAETVQRLLGMCHRAWRAADSALWGWCSRLVSCLVHLAALWALAALTWWLVLALRSPLVRLARPAGIVGGSLEWYWDLLCGSDRPCCRAR